jgi:diguanylate cyclase (GGDEF)-like protein
MRHGVDWAARYGGEEFLMVLPETDLKGAWVVAERLRKIVNEKPFRIENEDIALTASFGLASFDPSTDNAPSPEALIKEADEYLYQAKREGRNSVRGKNDQDKSSGSRGVR